MSINDITGWGSVALMAIAFYLLHRFITSPPKVLEKIIKDGSKLGLCNISRETAEGKLLESFLNPSTGSGQRKTKLGSIYKTNNFHGFLVEAVDIQHYRASGGKRGVRHDHKLKFVVMESTGLSCAFTVKPRPEMNWTYKFAMSVADKMGVGLNEHEEGLSEEFKKNFITFAIGESADSGLVPQGIQKLMVGYAESSDAGVDIMYLLNGGSGIVFLPTGIVINLSETQRPENPDDIRAIIDFTEALLREFKK
jgi:hypothetical protein